MALHCGTIVRSLCTFAALAALAALVDVAHAAAQRSFVASTGNDVANLAAGCTLAQPCRSFASAITQTNAGGEIVVLDSAGYGPVTIAKSISIVAPPGIYAGVSVFSGHGVTIATAGVKVKLSGLTINGQGGDRGISFTQGDLLVVERCTVRNMNTAGIYVVGNGRRATITDSRLESNGVYGVYAAIGAEVVVDRATVVDHWGTAAGVMAEVFLDGAVTRVVVTRSTFQRNGVAMQALNSGGGGFVRFTARDNTILGDADSGIGLSASCAEMCSIDSVIVAATGNSISSASIGVAADPQATVVLSGNDITQNALGVYRPLGAFYTMQNNTVEQNVTDVAAALSAQSLK